MQQGGRSTTSQVRQGGSPRPGGKVEPPAGSEYDWSQKSPGIPFHCFPPEILAPGDLHAKRQLMNRVFGGKKRSQNRGCDCHLDSTPWTDAGNGGSLHELTASISHSYYSFWQLSTLTRHRPAGAA